MIETPFVRPICSFAQRITLRLFSDWQVTGAENIPPMGPVILVVNHQSNIDPALLAVSVPRRAWFLAKADIFRGPIAVWFLKSWGGFALNREGVDVRAYRWVLNKLEQGDVVAVFPEGTRNPGGMKKAKSGVVQLALRTQAPLVPVGITGTERLGTWLRVLNPTGRLRVNIGRPFSIPTVEGKPSPELLESLTDMVMRRVAEMLPESYRGVYALAPDRGTGGSAEVAVPTEDPGAPRAKAQQSR